MHIWLVSKIDLPSRLTCLTHDTGRMDTCHMAHETWHMTHDTCHTWHMPHMTHDIWHLTYDTWHMAHNTWHMTHDTWTSDSWLMTQDTWHMTHDTWHMTHDTWQMTHDKWHMTNDTWHRTQDTWHMTNDTWHVTHDTWHMAWHMTHNNLQVPAVWFNFLYMFEKRKKNCSRTSKSLKFFNLGEVTNIHFWGSSSSPLLMCAHFLHLKCARISDPVYWSVSYIYKNSCFTFYNSTTVLRSMKPLYSRSFFEEHSIRILHPPQAMGWGGGWGWGGF